MERTGIEKVVPANQNYTGRIESLYRAGQEVEPSKKVRIIKDDPDDNKYLECTEECLAHYIISNDRHLLKVKSFHGTEIIRPVEFMRKSSI